MSDQSDHPTGEHEELPTEVAAPAPGTSPEAPAPTVGAQPDAPVDEPAAPTPAPEPTPAAEPPPEPPATTWDPPGGAPPQPESFASNSGSAASDRPEVPVAAAFAGGLALALILKRLAR